MDEMKRKKRTHDGFEENPIPYVKEPVSLIVIFVTCLIKKDPHTLPQTEILRRQPPV